MAMSDHSDILLLVGKAIEQLPSMHTIVGPNSARKKVEHVKPVICEFAGSSILAFALEKKNRA